MDATRMSLLNKAIEVYRIRKSWLGDGGEPVPLEQAQRRADTCLRCPNNQEKPIYEIFAGAVAHGVIRQLKTKDEMGLRVQREECLHVCDVCLCVLKLKVHVPLKFILASSSLDGLPEFCWQITEQKTQELNDKQNDRLHK